jgi:nicotinamide phosphoribosyltransferase
MYYERYEITLERMKKMKYAANSLNIGIGGIARAGSRDTLGMAQKATYIEVNGNPRDIMKSPITDPGKKSHTGRFQVYRDVDRLICTKDQASREQVAASLLQTVFLNGKVTNPLSFPQVRSYFDATRDH